MTRADRTLSLPGLLLLLGGCALDRYEPGPLDPGFRPPVGSGLVPPAAAEAADTQPVEPSQRPQPHGPLALDEVLAAVTERYPPYLSTLLERDLASGRLLQAMGSFDTRVSARLGSQALGFYEANTFGALLQQPLTTGDTIYGGYRVSDGFLPAYDKARTQDNGELVFGGRVPLFRDRAIDQRRASVRQAEIDVGLADPLIARARIDFVRAAARTYYAWVAAGRRLGVARELLQLATDRVGDLERAVDRQFLAPIEVTDNERLIAQRQVFVVRAERLLQQTALELSLFLRDVDDAPVVPSPQRLPGDLALAAPPTPASLQEDTEAAIRQRPELRRLQLRIDRVETDRQLAQNQTMPNLDLVVEASRSLSGRPYTDIEQDELFLGFELSLPLRQRDAYGRLEQANAALRQLRLEEQFARDRIVNDIADTRSALQAAWDQIEATQRNTALARDLVAAERRAFELGRSDLFRIQLRELALAEAQVLEIDARLDYLRAAADYRAALGVDGVPPPR
ncbi:MAG: TolC family protein [Planctomycetes bacterium]|nr:TolC family protein [Planctomycetota bacterium]